MRHRIWRVVAAAIAVSTGVALALPPAASAEPEAPVVSVARNPVAGTYLVTLADGSAAARSAAGAEHAARGLAERFGGRLRTALTATMRGFIVDGLPERQARRLAAHPDVAEVRQGGRAGIAGPGGTQSNPPNWGLDRIDQRDRPLDGRYTYPNDGAGVRVYIVDTGLRYTHTEFEGRAEHGVDLHSRPNDGVDCHKHGSHVGGIVAGRTRGVAKKANLVSVRVLGCDGFGEDVDLVEAAEWITRNAVKPAVVNLSVYTDDPHIATTAIKNSIASGIQWSLITGNNGGNACNYGPGGQVPEAVTVANSTDQDTRASDSNAGTCMDLFAPGSNIDSAFHTGDTAYGRLSGTSMAAPHVAGAMALRLSESPGSTPADLHRWVVDSASAGKMSGLASGVPNRLLHVPNPDTPPPGDPVARFTASCPTTGLACSFDGSGSTDPDGSVTAWAWDFGDGGTGGGARADHTYAAAGAYTVKLTVTDNAGRTNTTSRQVQVGGGGQAPTASFRVDCQAGLTCAFDGSGSRDADGSISSYAWDFGDGTSGTGVRVSHKYAAVSRTYTAKLTVTDDSGKTASVQKQVQCWSFGSGQGFCFGN